MLALQKEIALCEDEDQRRGVFTTNVLAQAGEHQVALFFTGQKHAGENLDRVLQQRAADLPKALQMCDGLARNHPKQVELTLCNCLLHGRRGFVDVIDRFPQEGRKVIESLGEIGGKSAFRALLELTSSDDLEVQEAAESAIANIQEDQSTER